MDEMKRSVEGERVLLVALISEEENEEDAWYRIDELKALTKTAGGQVVSTITQKRSRPHPSLLIGKGKVEEMAAFADEYEVDVIIFNDELSPSHIRNLGEWTEAKIIDRTQLILDIFASRATSKEGKLQVELAQYSYLLPRLRGQGQMLSRLGGGIGTRGPGETQLEIDQRHIRQRMTDLRQQLAVAKSHRERYRERRKQNQTFQIALVGYTNAGKSTLLNRLTEAGVIEEDKLFATLETTTRKWKLPSGMNVLLSDTVGFIEQLPTTLVEAFRSTLEEVKEADFLLHVVDGSHAEFTEHERSVYEHLDELNASHIPMLTVYNKRDQLSSAFYPATEHDHILISALDDHDLTKLSAKLEESLKKAFVFYEIAVAPNDGKLLSRLLTETIQIASEWNEDAEMYDVTGYVKEDAPIYGEIEKRKNEQDQ
ncbi:GTP-binding protein HflX [Texcoconibacillus texcoconensis]|uniref:GTPase HflX n=2 Tax=Texcoconibacillus texcoconensis TaxID=1095777 RepID=A0A840QUZ7_9BACI|nr:GTP-binding protein HflX [Texcoconibacillus texcoconensis]